MLVFVFSFVLFAPGLLHSVPASSSTAAAEPEQAPHFTMEMPQNFDFSNSTGGKLMCSAEGSPQPTTQWILSDGSPVIKVPGLRQVDLDGTLVFLPFKSKDYRPDVHGITYSCSATNSLGTLVSTEVKVRGIVDQSFDVHVYDVYVIKGNTAIMKCHIPEFLSLHVTVVSWIKDSVVSITSANLDSNSKYAFLPSGELLIKNVDSSDAHTTYRCQVSVDLTNELKTSVNYGRLIVTESQGRVPPKILYTQAVVRAVAGKPIFLPCVANGYPDPTYNWTKQEISGNVKHILQTKGIKFISGSLLIEEAKLSDGGIFMCEAKNDLNVDKVSTQIIVVASLTAVVTIADTTLDANEPANINCKITGAPVNGITWLKDGKSLRELDLVQTKNETVHIPKMTSNLAGIYQCFANNEMYSTFGMVILKLGNSLPEMIEGFEEKTLEPGNKLSMKCTARGNPSPTIIWTLDSIELPKHTDRNQLESTGANEVTSIFTISHAQVNDGGLYRCVAKNAAGETEQSRRINVIGPVGIRANIRFQATDEGLVQIDCPFYGFPIQSIKWEKNRRLLPFDVRHEIYKNGSLIIRNIKRQTDSGKYGCIVQTKDQAVRGVVELQVTVPPKVTPFSFQDDLITEGARARVQCVVSQGESPLEIIWLKNGRLISREQGIAIRNLDEFSSILMISSINPRHNGNYTCMVTNAAGSASHTALLFVNVPPKILPFAFQDDQFFKGMRAHIICAVSQGDLPIRFEWLKDNRPISPSLGVNIRNYDGHANSMSIDSVSAAHTGNYTCIASNQAAKTSHTAQLLVQVAPKITPFSFRSRLSEGSLARISCVIHQGDLPLKLEWLKNDHPIQANESILVRTIDDYSSILTVERVQIQHSGNYTCVASNKAATVSYTAQLLVHVPPKVVPFTFQDEFLLDGMLVRVSCVVSCGDLPLEINWSKDGRHISNRLEINIRQFDEYSSVLSIDPVSSIHSGNYTCTAKNNAGVASHTAKLTVQVPPHWTTKPHDVITQSGKRIFLDCQASGFPIPVISWEKAIDSENLVGGSRPIVSDDYITVYQNGTLAIENTQRFHEGLYICFASNDATDPINEVVSVQIQSLPEFEIAEEKITAKKGDNVAILCNAYGNWPISYTWSVDNEKIKVNNGNNRYKIESNQDTIDTKSASTLLINGVDRKDSVVFTCSAKNEIGESQKKIRLIVHEFPDPPIIETPIKVNNQTIDIYWSVAYNGNSPILRYIIQYKKEVDRWSDRVESVVLPGSDHYTRIGHLKPATLYDLRMLAMNDVGNGTFSDVVTVKTEDAIPQGPPENIEVESTDANTLRVTWKPPKKNLWNGAIRGYNIGHKIYDSSDEGYSFSSLEVPEDYTDDLIFQISDLNMYTQYNIIVQAYNSKGNGPSSEAVLAMTSEDVPSSPPQGVRCSSLSSKSIYVLWESPSHDTINGILRGYKILYKPVSEWYDALMQSKVTQVTKSTLQNLNVNTNYSIQVLAFTKAGDGMKSLSVYCKTHEDVPDPPEAVKVLPSSSDSVVVAWKPSHRTNGALIKYNIYYKTIEDGQQIDIENQKTEELQRDATIYESQADTQFVELKGLKKNKKYAFWVTATSTIGESSYSTVVAQTVADSIVPAKSASFNSVINIPWKEDVVLACNAVGVPAPNRKWTIGNEAIVEHNRLKVTTDGSALITKATSEESGNYTCTVYNEFGRDEVSYVVNVQVPPSPPILDVISKTRSSFKLQWKPGVNGGDDIKGYLLHYKRDNGVWETQEIRPDQTLYTLEKLDCGASYQLYIEAFNNIGTGLPCDILTITTDGTDVVAPLKESIIREGSTFITVNLDAWPSSGCPVQGFAVEYKRMSGNEWTTVGTNIRPIQKKLVISSLTPATWYILRLTVDSNGSPTIAEYRFATHTTSGGTVAPEIFSESFAPVYIFYLDPLIFIPAIALLIVVIIASVVVCLYFKRRNGSVGTPSADSMDIGPHMNTWIRNSQTLPRGSFGDGGKLATLSRRNTNDPSPYATSHLTDLYEINSHGQIISGISGQGFIPLQHKSFQTSTLGFDPRTGLNESTFVFPTGEERPEFQTQFSGATDTDDGYDPPPIGHMIPNTIEIKPVQV